MARSGFYFYFDSKYAVLAQILGEVAAELEEATHAFAPRGDDETPAQFACRMVGTAAAVYAHNDPVMSACNIARATDAEIREILDRYNEAVIDQIVPIVESEIRNGTAEPITAEVRGLVRTLCGGHRADLVGESLSSDPMAISSGRSVFWRNSGCTHCGADGLASRGWVTTSPASRS